jgi:hypothetical protein
VSEKHISTRLVEPRAVGTTYPGWYLTPFRRSSVLLDRFCLPFTPRFPISYLDNCLLNDLTTNISKFPIECNVYRIFGAGEAAKGPLRVTIMNVTIIQLIRGQSFGAESCRGYV